MISTCSDSMGKFTVLISKQLNHPLHLKALSSFGLCNLNSDGSSSTFLSSPSQSPLRNLSLTDLLILECSSFALILPSFSIYPPVWSHDYKYLLHNDNSQTYISGPDLQLGKESHKSDCFLDMWMSHKHLKLNITPVKL